MRLPFRRLIGAFAVQRILILGCPGSGKTTLARGLGHEVGLPVIHLDDYYWGPRWTRPNSETWHRTVECLAAGDRWIIDGNHQSSLGLRLARADAIVVLDIPTWRCLLRVAVRSAARQLGDRESLPARLRDEPKGGFSIDLRFVAMILAFDRNLYLRSCRSCPTSNPVSTSTCSVVARKSRGFYNCARRGLAMRPSRIDQFSDFDGAINFRPIAMRISPVCGRLFRSGDLSGVSREVADRMVAGVGIEQFIDLRSHSEQNAAPPVELLRAGLQWLRIPMRGLDRNFRSNRHPRPIDYAAAYSRMIETDKHSIASFFGALASSPATSIVFGCLVGKDRTGVVAAILLGLLGATREQAAYDFSRSCRPLQDALDSFRPLWVAKGLSRGDYSKRLVCQPEDPTRVLDRHTCALWELGRISKICGRVSGRHPARARPLHAARIPFRRS